MKICSDVLSLLKLWHNAWLFWCSTIPNSVVLISELNPRQITRLQKPLLHKPLHRSRAPQFYSVRSKDSVTDLKLTCNRIDALQQTTHELMTLAEVGSHRSLFEVDLRFRMKSCFRLCSLLKLSHVDSLAKGYRASTTVMQAKGCRASHVVDVAHMGWSNQHANKQWGT